MRLIDLDDYQIFRCLSLEANEQFKSVRFRPLAGFALLQAKEEAKKSLLLRSLLRKLFVYVGLLAVIFAVNYAPNAGNTAFLLSKSLDTMLVETRFNRNESFKTISCSDDFWNWLKSVYVNQLCTDGDAWNASSHYQYLVGPSRLRQLRSKKVSCLVRNKYGDKVGSEYDLCDGDPGWHEDTAFHQPHWKPAFDEANDTWKFHSAHSLNSIPYKGILGWYGGGGYVSLLPSSYTDAVEKINQMMSEDWIDDGTRVVMLEFTVYNGNVDLFASVVMVVEFGLTGATYTTWHTYIFHPFVYPSADVAAMILLESILFIYAIYLTIVIVLTIRKSCARFCKDIWTYVNVVITCLCWSSVILFILMVLLDTRTYDHAQNNSNGSTFVDFRESGATHFAWVCINAFLLMLTLILAVKQLRFVKLFATFYLTFRVSFCVIFGCTLIYSLLMVIYCLTAYLWFGSELLQFHSVGASFLTLVAIFHGDAQVMVAMGDAHLGFSIVFIAVYLSAIWFGVHSLIAGAFVRAYGMMRKQVNYHNAIKAHDHDIIPFLVKQLKRWIQQKDKSKAAFRKVKFQDFSTLSTVSSARSSLPFDDDELSADVDEISDDSERSSDELHENDSTVLHLVTTDSTETVQDDLNSSLDEEDVTIATSRDDVATILSSSAAEETTSASSLAKDSVDEEIAVPNLTSQQPKDVTDVHGELSVTDVHGELSVTDVHGELSAANEDCSDDHANPEDVLRDMDDSSLITVNDNRVESVIPAVTRVLEQLDKIVSNVDDDDVDWRIKAATEKYLRKRINYHRNSSRSHGSLDERTGLTKIVEASQEANRDRAVVCGQLSPCSSEVEMTSSALLAMRADLENEDMTTACDDIGRVPMRTVAPPHHQTDRLLVTSHQETWV